MAKGSSGFDKGGNKNSALVKNAERVTINTYHIAKSSMGPHYGYTVVEAQESSEGNISLSYAKAYFKKDRGNANTQNVVFEFKHGIAESRKGQAESYGINWDNVKSITGQTYEVKDYIRKKGFKWDNATKRWIKI